MNLLLGLFAANILPIFLAAGAGFLFGKHVDVNPRTISRVVFYIFSPALVFKLLTANELEGEAILQITSFAIVFIALLGSLTLLAGRLLKLERTFLIAILLTTMFTNAGNYGLSVNAFAFGEVTLAYASLYFVTNSTMAYSLGIVVASMGKTDLRSALANLFKFPAVYAAALAILFNRFDLSLPLPVDRTVTLFSQAAIPSMLVLLGLQLQRATWTQRSLALGLATGLRLLVAPVLAVGLGLLFGLQGPARQAGVLESSMPSAVLTMVLATEFDVEPAFVTTVVTTTTLLSPLTLTPLLAYLQ